MRLWQVGADINVGPGLAVAPATGREVIAALNKAGYNTSEVEQVDEGLFLIPLTEAQEDELQREGHIEFSLELPIEARPTDIPKPEFAEYVNFGAEMP